MVHEKIAPGTLYTSNGYIEIVLCCGIVLWTLIGCENPKPSDESLVFHVDETCLEPTITDPNLKIEIAAPKGWKVIDDATLGRVVDRLGETLTQGIQIAPRWVFMDELTQAMCVVSTLEGVSTAPDGAFFRTLESAYRRQFPMGKVQRAAFRKDAFRVHQLMVVASNFVLIKLICDAPESLVFAVDYVVPIDVYQQQLRSIESSIGSLNLISPFP